MHTQTRATVPHMRVSTGEARHGLTRLWITRTKGLNVTTVDVRTAHTQGNTRFPPRDVTRVVTRWGRDAAADALRRTGDRRAVGPAPLWGKLGPDKGGVALQIFSPKCPDTPQGMASRIDREAHGGPSSPSPVPTYQTAREAPCAASCA